MQAVGFDANILIRTSPFDRKLAESQPASNSEVLEAIKPPFKAMLGVAITTKDFEVFKSEYDSCIAEMLKKYGLARKKRVYKGAHLLKQNSEVAPKIMIDFIGELNPVIDYIDIFCAYYHTTFISIYGEARGERLHPLTFIDRNWQSFEHICAWKYVQKYKPKSAVLQIDHFSGKVTEAWRELISQRIPIEIYFSGGETNPLISVSDMLLRIIDTFQFGNVDGKSLLKPIRDYFKAFEGKYRFTNLGATTDDLRYTVPCVPFDIETSRFLKHPIFYYLWNIPKERKDQIKPSFEWSELYNTTMNAAFVTNGCVKQFEYGKDDIKWDVEKDYLVPWEESEKETTVLLEKIHGKIPKVLTLDALKQLGKVKE